MSQPLRIKKHPMSQMSLLTIEQLTVEFHQHDTSTRAADRVSFAIEPGEIVALVGESGSGKTSVALAVTRLLPTPPASLSGRIAFAEGTSAPVNLLDLPEPQLRTIRGKKISYVFQDPGTSLNPVLTIGEQLVEAIEQHTPARGTAARQRAVEWLRRMGLPDAEHRLAAYPHEFSGGMQQRVMLAMAVATEPALLIADEPTTALDVTVQVQILRLLRELQRALRLSVLLISHDLTVVERLAHRVGVMSKGRLVEWGAVQHVLHQPTHPDTQQLLRYRSMMSLRRRPTNG